MPAMNKQMAEVMLRRGKLLARIAAQREQVARYGARLQTPLAFADQVLVAVRFLRSHPILAGGAVALIVIRRHGVLGLLKRTWQLWKGYRYLSALSTKLWAERQIP